MPPLHPFLRQQLLGLSPSAIFLLLHMLCAKLGASVLGCLFCLLLISRTLACLPWERYTLHFFLEYSMQSIVFQFLATVCQFALVFPVYLLLELISFLFRSVELSLVFHSYFVEISCFVALVVSCSQLVHFGCKVQHNFILQLF